MGLSASPAQACAVYCRGRVVNNQLDRPCMWCGQNKNHIYLYMKTCTSSCGYSFNHCSRRKENFCLSRNQC